MIWILNKVDTFVICLSLFIVIIGAIIYALGRVLRLYDFSEERVSFPDQHRLSFDEAGPQPVCKRCRRAIPFDLVYVQEWINDTERHQWITAGYAVCHCNTPYVVFGCVSDQDQTDMIHSDCVYYHSNEGETAFCVQPHLFNNLPPNNQLYPPVIPVVTSDDGNNDTNKREKKTMGKKCDVHHCTTTHKRTTLFRRRYATQWLPFVTRYQCWGVEKCLRCRKHWFVTWVSFS